MAASDPRDGDRAEEIERPPRVDDESGADPPAPEQEEEEEGISPRVQELRERRTRVVEREGNRETGDAHADRNAPADDDPPPSERTQEVSPQSLSPRGQILHDRKKFVLMSERLERTRHGDLETDEEGEEEPECFSPVDGENVQSTSLPYYHGNSHRGMRFHSSEDAITRDKQEAAAAAAAAEAAAEAATEDGPVYLNDAGTRVLRPTECPACPPKDPALAVSSGNLYCRICFEGEEEKGEPLLSNVCGCTGTMAHLHKTCLEKWVMESKTLTCEICKRTIRLPQSSELEEWRDRIETLRSQRSVFSVQAEVVEVEEPAMFQQVENRRLRSCLQRVWRSRGAMNSSIIVLVGTSILVMMSLVLYHFLSPTREKVIAGALPPGQSIYEPFNCTMQVEETHKTVKEAIGWLCGVPAIQIYKGECTNKMEQEPCGEWSQFTLLQSSIPRCFFGHGSICYVALEPGPGGGVCMDGVCTPFNETDPLSLTDKARHYENGLLAQGRCVACT